MKKFLQKLLNRKKSCVAIDVGTSEIKAAEIRAVSGFPAVSTLYKLPTPPGVFAGGLNPEVLAGALKQIAEECHLQNKTIISSIWGDKVITRHIEVPAMPAKELKKAVRWEAEKFIPVPVDDMIIEFVRLGEAEKPEAGGTKQEHLLLAAVAADLVYNFYNAFEAAGMRLSALDLQPFALWRVFGGTSKVPFFKAEGDPGREGTLAVADIGASTTHIVFIKGGQLKYTRALPAGGNVLTESLQQAFAVDFDAARKMKEETGLLNMEGEIDYLMRAGIEELVKELRRSLDFYKTRERKSPVKKLLITGGGSKLKGLAPFLSEELGLPVEPGVLKNGEGYIDPAFTVSIGLALREVVD